MPSTIKELAKFLERMNNEPESHVGYCGEQEEEIYESLLRDFSEVGLERSFSIGYRNNKIIAAIGLDIDSEGQSAEIWGPFIEVHDLVLLNQLWKDVITKCGVPIKTFHFFINEKNERGKKFINSHGGITKGDHIVLQAERYEFVMDPEVQVVPYNSRYKSAFYALHQQEFPNTYFSADDIINRINSANQLLVLPDGENGMKGYVYVEANPKHHEGSIEFIAVSDRHRKQGIGTQLIHAALSHLFSYPEIEEITLSVGKENIIAIRLYQAAGFKVKYTLTHFVIER